MKYIIFPLSNPGKKYENTRHNAGQIFIKSIYKNKDFLNFLKENEFFILENEYFMNNAGDFLKDYIKKNKLKIKKENLIIVYDDKDIEIGRSKLSIGRNSGGHNGLQNIIDRFKTKDFYRFRLGIGKRKTENKNSKIENIKEFVLENFSEEDKNFLQSEKNYSDFQKALLLILKEKKIKK